MHSVNQKVAPCCPLLIAHLRSQQSARLKASQLPVRSAGADLISITSGEPGMIDLGCREDCRRSLTLTKVLPPRRSLVVASCWPVGELKVLLLVRCSGERERDEAETRTPQRRLETPATRLPSLRAAGGAISRGPVPVSSARDPLVRLMGLGTHRVARMREKEMTTERVVWPTPNTRASSGAMSFPATRYTPATAAPV